MIHCEGPSTTFNMSFAICTHNKYALKEISASFREKNSLGKLLFINIIFWHTMVEEYYMCKKIYRKTRIKFEFNIIPIRFSKDFNKNSVKLKPMSLNYSTALLFSVETCYAGPV